MELGSFNINSMGSTSTGRVVWVQLEGLCQTYGVLIQKLSEGCLLVGENKTCSILKLHLTMQVAKKKSVAQRLVYWSSMWEASWYIYILHKSISIYYILQLLFNEFPSFSCIFFVLAIWFPACVVMETWFLSPPGLAPHKWTGTWGGSGETLQLRGWTVRVACATSHMKSWTWGRSI